MGRKKKNREEQQKPWCFYCDREFVDEPTLVQHQKSKHFKCPDCNRKLNTAGGLTIHAYQVHKRTITEIPAALPGREAPDREIFGMAGVPDGGRPGDPFGAEESQKKARTDGPGYMQQSGPGNGMMAGPMGGPMGMGHPPPLHHMGHPHMGPPPHHMGPHMGPPPPMRGPPGPGFMPPRPMMGLPPQGMPPGRGGYGGPGMYGPGPGGLPPPQMRGAPGAPGADGYGPPGPGLGGPPAAPDNSGPGAAGAPGADGFPPGWPLPVMTPAAGGPLGLGSGGHQPGVMPLPPQPGMRPPGGALFPIHQQQQQLQPAAVGAQPPQQPQPPPAGQLFPVQVDGAAAAGAAASPAAAGAPGAAAAAATSAAHVAAGAPAADALQDAKLVWNDEAFSPEERRSLLPKFARFRHQAAAGSTAEVLQQSAVPAAVGQAAVLIAPH